MSIDPNAPGGLSGVQGAGPTTGTTATGSPNVPISDTLEQALQDFIQDIVDAKAPILPKPNDPAAGLPKQDPDEVRQQLNEKAAELIKEMPGAKEIIKALTKELQGPPHNLSPEEAKKQALANLSSGVVQSIEAKTGLPDNIQALGTDLRDVSGQLLHRVAEDKGLSKVASELLFDNIANNNPQFKILTEVLKQTYISQGMSETEALAKAKAEAFGMVSKAFSDKGIASPPLGPHSLYNEAIMTSLLGFVEELDHDSAVALVGGVVAGMQLTEGFMSWLTDVSQVVPTSQNSLIKSLGIKLAGNVFQSMDDLFKEIQEVLDDLPIPEKDRLALADFLKAIAAAIADIRQILHELAMADSKLTKENQALEIDLSEQRAKAGLDKLYKQLEAIKKAKSMKALTLTLKIITPIITALIMVAAIAVAPVSFPVGTIALIAVSLMVFAAITAFTQSGLMDKAFNKVMTAVVDALKSTGLSEDASKGIFGAVMALIVIVMIVGAIVGVPGAGTAVNMMIMMIGIQLAVTMLTSSNAIGHMTRSATLAAGGSEKDAAIATAVVTAVAMIAISIATMGRGASMSSGAQGGAKFANLFARFSKVLTKVDKGIQLAGKAAPIVQGAGQTLTSAASIANGINELSLAELAVEQSELEAIVQMLTQLIKALQQVLKNLQSGTGEHFQAMQELTDMFAKLTEDLSKISTQLSQAA